MSGWRRQSRAMPEDNTVDQCRNCQEWLTFLFGEGWVHRLTGKFQCDWLEQNSSVASPEHWPT